MSEVREKASKAQATVPQLNRLNTEQKNTALRVMADALIKETDSIITANAEDLERGREQGTPESMLDRLALNKERIAGIAEGLRQIADLPDPVGEVLETFTRPNGLHVEKLRVPIGLIGIIYEARPNVTVDAAGLCLKTGNAVLLRGGSSALSSNRKIVEVLHQALTTTDMPANALQLVEDADRASVDEMLKLNGLLDVIIPRGGLPSFVMWLPMQPYLLSKLGRAFAIPMWMNQPIQLWQPKLPSMPRHNVHPYVTPWKRCCCMPHMQKSICLLLPSNSVRPMWS